MQWSTACLDWEERILSGRSLITPPPLFPDEAAAALEVFKSLRIVDVAGRPTFGEAARDWVFDFVEAIFGAYDANTGVRMIEEFFLLISKKNGKSTIAAGIMLTALIRNWRDSAELLILAPTLEIANNSFKPAADMVRADPQLRDLLHVHDSQRTITHRLTKATLKVVAADPNVVGGKKAAFILVDELWLFGKQANSDSMLSEATGGRASRHEGFVVYLSTHSDEPPAGVFKDKLEIFRKVRDGELDDPKKLPVLYEFPTSYLENELYLDPKNWRITNPNMGLSQTESFIKSKLDDATDPGKKRVAFAKWLNVEIGQNLRGDRWPGAAHWEKAIDEEMFKLAKGSQYDALQNMLSRCECITIGTDGGGLDDLFGFTALGRLPGEIEVEFEVFGRPVKQKMKRWLSWSHAWCHKGILENRKSIASKLLDFQKDGELTIVDDSLEDLGAIIELIRIVKDSGKLGGVGVDPAGIGDLVDLLEDDLQITEENKLLFGVPQGFGMMNAIKTTERRLAKGLLKHSGSRLMAWCVGNLKIEPTATAIRATKQTAGDAKIDPVMALFDAATVMRTNPQPAHVPDYQVFVLG
jgi:phage terminase large subunit-like protein